jgi:electron transport complex protein RnfG
MSGKDNLNPYLVVCITGLTLICVLLVSFIDSQTRDKISQNQIQARMLIFDDIIPETYTNEIFSDTIQVSEPNYLGTSRPVTIYRARNNDEPLSIIIYPVVAQGYVGDIELGIGISKLGIVNGVRVVHEEETSGLGDQVHQGKTDWIQMFSGRSLTDPPRDNWRVASDNGYFDQLSGATITSRSVISAVKGALEYHEIAQDSIYAK